MNRTALTLAAALGAALPLGGAFAATVPGSFAQEYAQFDRAAQADLRHAAADLAVTHSAPGGAAVAPTHARVMAARNWIERAETELLNRASFRDDGQLTQGQPIVPDAATSYAIDARTDLAKGDLRDARSAVRHDLRELRAELPRA